MPVYEYTALNASGKTVSGIIDSDSPQMARQKLRTTDFFTVSIQEVDEAAKVKETRFFSLENPFARVRPSEIAMMTRQLSTLVGAGIPLVAAFESLVSLTKSHAFQKKLVQIKGSILEGNSFAAALKLFPAIFSPVYINMVRSGETSGTLEIVLDRLADITEKQEALKNRIQTALIYPALMSVIGAIVLFLLLTFIVPSITTIFEDMNQVLPAPTRLLISLSKLLKSYGWVILIAMMAALLLVKSIKKTSGGLIFLDRIRLSFPIVGPLSVKIAVVRFTRTLGSLLENGIPLMASLEIVKNIVGNVIISRVIEDATAEVVKGQGLGAALSRGKIFPLLPIQMIQVGEQSGKLESMLHKVSDVFENEVESAIMRITALIEPLMILVMGVIIGFIVFSICLPIFEMNQLVR
ncbi:MAG: type II secretion system F family protein [Desulfobacterales bacterium]|nr:type II secretion system F family protein [Desulfobacterales bacterium]